jgi:hypothetical protein
MSLRVRVIAGAVALGALAAAFTATDALAQDPSCRQVFNGIKLQANTPNHQYITISGAEADSHVQTNEMINTGRARFIRIDGQWQKSPQSPHEIMKIEEENFKKSKTVCRALREEVIDGTAATVYVEQSQTGPISSVGTIWIANRSGLPLREEVNTDSGTGPAGQRHLEIRIVYSDAQTPVEK